MAFDHSKFLIRFVEEAREHCLRIGEGLLNLETNPEDAELVNALFRSAHTIKGSSRMMKLSGVTELAHRMEDILDSARSGQLSIADVSADLLFSANKALQGMLDQICAGNKNPETPEELCAQMVALLENQGQPETQSLQQSPKPSAAETSPEPPATKTSTETVVTEIAQQQITTAKEPQAVVKKEASDYLRIKAQKIDELIGLMGEIVSEHSRFKKQVSRWDELLRKQSKYQQTVAGVMNRLQADQEDTFILQQAGVELQEFVKATARELKGTVLLQNHLIDDLQQTSLEMRMLPLTTIFEPLRHTVRELAQEFGKPLNFTIEGGETELDRKIIDRLGDSLIHLIRNALDHGLEPTEERLAAGKPPKGNLSLSACFDSGCVTILLSDDGRGIQRSKVREKALSKRMFDENTVKTMPDSDLVNLIFAPGFSTSPIVTDISGRGVGMDVVKKSITNDLKGAIFVDSTEGKGTVFHLRLPLNLAVFPLFMVTAANKTCAVPATSIVEILSVCTDEVIDIVGKRAVSLREQLIPVERLSLLLGLDDSGQHPDELLIVIVRDGEYKLGLIVDELLGQQDMVVKPLPDHMRNLKLVSGVTIGGHGLIINLLNIPSLLQAARKVVATVPAVREARANSTYNILVVDDSYNTREIEKSILEANGYHVETAVDGEDGYAKTRETLYDLVITDVEMPNLDGFSFTEKLRADERYRLIPVIIVTSRAKDEDKKRGIQAGANAYIIKGAFDQTNLIETVESLL